ncbi:spore maturation protein A [Thermoanaerobacter thermohydrosulfuricus]|uniref:Spore maturation protein A n=3 Tax=Thermoanaerobacter TaxID=1754 RepID=A0A1I2AKN6_THETY|nr:MULTISPECIES: nucleoside recognition domain-containing protein [Thermoanaerobacter]AIS51314.1 spore maturation protein A [Thermoanaerobacter kivui]EMT38450.1 putative membrane protein, required for spore maturation in Bsubtilis [Thermoanaerobacter thermohydrosulfuricus WC1]UZQ83120.1 nucleoside recognition protein [Thermoanaerobacter sp. RKWS2]SDG33270.1 spore maturation protein A [Thermoanaerobacter thermohydrosulfuricus]SFE44574.1 spore maturation protein A [Thermoanaerobacter thermohydro
MINYIWFFMIAIGVLVGIINGRMAEVSKAIIDSAQTAVAISIGLVGVMSLWLGIMKIADKSGLTDIIAKLLKPTIIRLFPDVPKDHPAISAMIMNISANMLGLGNAATPFGIKAMEYLQELNKKDSASNAMGRFLVINTASIQLIPAVMIGIRASLGAKNPADFVIVSVLSTSTALVAGLILNKYLEKMPIFKE